MSKRSGLAVVLCMLLGLPVGWASSQVEYEFEGGQWIPTTAPAEGTPEGELAIIRRCVDRGANRSAVNRARNFLKKYPDSPARQEVMMLAGVAEMNRGMYFQAYEWFEKQLAESPDGRYSARSLDCEYAIAGRSLAERNGSWRRFSDSRPGTRGWTSSTASRSTCPVRRWRRNR